MPARLVIFDLDGVLCQYELQRRLEVLGELAGRPPEAVRASLWGSGFEDDADAGVYATPEDYLDAFRERLGHRLTIADWIEARRAAMTPNHDVLALANRLGQLAKIAVLTNNVPLLKVAMAEVFPEVPQVFGSHIFYSCDFKMRKPEPGLYRSVVGSLGIKPENAFFTDDSEANVEGAMRAGLIGHHFAALGPLVETLRTSGFKDI